MNAQKAIRAGALSFYHQLAKQVAEEVVEHGTSFEEAMLKVSKQFYDNHLIEAEMTLKLAGKTREDWKRDAILESRGVSLKRI